MIEAGIQEQPVNRAGSLSRADIVLGILSYNNADTIGRVTSNVQVGMAACFPNLRAVMVNADGGSRDGTQETALASVVNKDDFVQVAFPVYPAQKISPQQFGIPGKANGVQAILGIACDLNAAACAIIDSTASVASPETVEAFVKPVIERDIDFVSPLYLRHKYDAAILNGIVYPLTRALYGKRIHQPIGGDYALSSRLMKHLAPQVRPDGDTTSSGADAWIIGQALCGGFRCAEASLGLRVLSPHEPALDADALLAQALHAVFTEMNRSAAFWQRIRGSQPVPAFGPHFEPLPDPPPVDPNPMLQSFRLGYQNLQDIYRLVLPPASLMELKRMSGRTAEAFHFDEVLWARVIYDFALAWRMRIMDRDHLLGALTPLYMGWVASWVSAVRNASPDEAQDCIEGLCMAYETQKAYLISRWRWPDRFNP